MLNTVGGEPPDWVGPSVDAGVGSSCDACRVWSVEWDLGREESAVRFEGHEKFRHLT